MMVSIATPLEWSLRCREVCLKHCVNMADEVVVRNIVRVVAVAGII